MKINQFLKKNTRSAFSEMFQMKIVLSHYIDFRQFKAIVQINVVGILCVCVVCAR